MRRTVHALAALGVLSSSSLLQAAAWPRRGFPAAGVVAPSARGSANYSIVAEIADGGGQASTSTNYSQSASFGAVVGVSSVASPLETAKVGYLGQLYEIVGLQLNAASLSIAENATLQLGGGQLLDDATTLALPASALIWNVAAGPLASIDSTGLATAGTVYQNTGATARGVYAGFTATLRLTVLNVNTDDYGGYAGDGIDDAWQVRYFGAPPNADAGPGVDADGTGQTNLFKYVAGLDPLDPASRFTLKIVPVPGQPSRYNLVFGPILGGRAYTVQARSSVGDGTWNAIHASAASDNGGERTVTDLDAPDARKFYQVRITKP